MRVLEAISDTNIGGAGRLLQSRLEESRGRDITTAVVLPRGSLLVRGFRDIGVECYEIDGCSDKSFDIGAVRKISRVIEEFSPDIVNAHGCMSARISAYIEGVPTRIYTRHCAFEVSGLMKCLPIKKAVGAVSSLLSTNVIAVADAARQNLLDMGVPSSKISVIINGARALRKYSEEERRAARRELGIDNEFVVGICARIERCKDHESFLRAARVLVRRGENYKFLIIGDGSERARAQALTKALGIDDYVIFTGFCENTEKYMNCLDLNVNCSVGTETSSLALSEGMSIGLPCVASSYGGNTYMVRHGENGLIYEAGDFLSLAQAIMRIAGNPALYRKMSENAYRRFCDELNAKKMAEQVLGMYTECYLKHTRK